MWKVMQASATQARTGPGRDPTAAKVLICFDLVALAALSPSAFLATSDDIFPNAGQSAKHHNCSITQEDRSGVAALPRWQPDELPLPIDLGPSDRGARSRPLTGTQSQ